MKKIICLIISLSCLLGIIPFSDRLGDITPSISIEEFTSQVQEINLKYKDEPASNTIIVKSKYNIPELDSVAIAEGYDDLHIVQFDNVQSAANALAYYNEQKLIEYAEADMTVSTCEATGADIMRNYGNHFSWGSNSIAVDDYVDTLSEIENLPEITVGIIDTGIDLDHEFLQNRITETGYNISSSGIENSEDDDNGHGTHVAGIIADNTTDNIKIKAYKALDSTGNGSLSSIVAAINYAVKDNVKVINMSLGGKGESTSMENAVNKAVKAGVVICVSAGNSGADANKYTPAGIESCITVAAIDEYNKKPFWSNWGEDIVDIVAPGVAIYSTYNNGKYETLSGTSMACPFVSASAALMLSKDINQAPQEVCDLLVANGRKWTKATNNGLAGILALFIGNVETQTILRTKQPYFSFESGRYTDSIMVEITCDDEDAEIYYTTDGTRATEANGTLYTEPIVIDKVTTLSASAYAPDKIKSIQNTAHYYVTYLDDNSNFDIDSNGIITKYRGANNYLTVPDSINEITVTGIGYQAFMNSKIVMIKLPDTVTTIGEKAFNQCAELYSVDAKNIKEVDKWGFRLCRKLEVFDFSKVKSIGEYAFQSCKSLTSINGDNIKSIDKYAFANCEKIISINIPECITIGERGFLTNMKLEHISMENIESIGMQAFTNCLRLQELFLPNLKEIGKKVFYNCSHLTVAYLPEVKIIDADNSAINLELIFAPKLETLNCEISRNNCKLYLSESFTNGIETSKNYTIIAPSGSYAEQWAEENGHTFMDSKSCSYSGVSGNNFVYTCSSNNEVCTMPIDMVEKMWHDYKPINKAPDFMTHGFIFDTVTDNIINAKDFSVLYK